MACVGGGSNAMGIFYPYIDVPNVKLIGVDSVMAPIDRRVAAWSNLASEIKSDTLEKITQQISLADAVIWAPKILAGEVRGRLVVDVNA